MTTDFGRDTYCLDSLATGRYATGVELLAQRCYHRLITPRPSLIGGEDEANFGIDLSELLGTSSTPAKLQSVAGTIQNELLKDPEVESVVASVEETKQGAECSWVVSVVVQSGQGPFDLVLRVDGVGVSLVGLNAGE